MQKAHQCSILLCSLPVIDEVLERGEEFNDALLDLRSQSILVGEEEDQVLVHAHVGRIDGSIELGCMQYPMIVDLVDRLLEICPSWQTKFQFFLCTLQTGGTW